MHEAELHFIHFIHQFRTPFLDQVFKFLNFFDTRDFFLILIPALWVSIHWKVGLRVFYFIFLSSMINAILKEIFHSPRPFHIDPSLAVIEVNGFGFPSGAAEAAVLLSGLLIAYWKNKWKWVLATSYFLLISFSRVYLGVHFPTDILGGWVIGFSLLALVLYAAPRIERHVEKWKPLSLFFLSMTIPAGLMVISQFSPYFVRNCALLMGVGTGIYVSHIFKLFLPKPLKWQEKILRMVIAVSAIFLVQKIIFLSITGTSIFAILSRYFLLGLWLGVGSHMLCRLIKPTEQRVC